MVTKIAFTSALLTLALAATNAFAFYGTEVETYRVNPWLDRLRAGDAMSTAGATARTASEATVNDTLRRFWDEAQRASHGVGR